MKEMLQEARRAKSAIGAFNILDYNSMKAVVDAAEELQSAVIVQTSVKTVLFWGYETLIKWYRELASRAKVPVAIHLDHCKDLKVIEQCIHHGWTSVMIDASSFPFEQNMEMSEKVVRMAHPRGITVEAELGEIGGVEDDIQVAEEDAHLARPEKVFEFLRRVPVDCFAPAIGTAHGVYKGEPRVAFHLVEEIGKGTDTPLALHGGTGLGVDVFKKCILLGCAKVNISTELKYAFIDGFCDYHHQHAGQYDPLKVLDHQYENMKEKVAKNIRIFTNP